MALHDVDSSDIALSTHEFSELVDEIYESALTGDWADTLDTIIEVTQSNKAFFLLYRAIDEAPEAIQINFNFEHSTGLILDYQSRVTEDPFYVIGESLTEGESMNCNDYINIDDYKHLSIYKEIFVPMRTHHVLEGVLIRDGEYDSTWSINRGPSDPAYSSKDVNLFSLLTNHFCRAVRIYRDLGIYKRYANLSLSVLNQATKGIIVCDENGEILLSNDYAEKLALSSHSLSFHGNQLVLNDAFDHARLRRYISQCAVLSYSRISVQESLVIDADDMTQTLITVAPLKPQDDISDLDRPCALVTVTQESKLNWDAVDDIVKLTPRETDLLKAIYSKKKLNDLTTTFGVSYNTLRTHLQNIFKKFEVNSQAELMAKLALYKY